MVRFVHFCVKQAFHRRNSWNCSNIYGATRICEQLAARLWAGELSLEEFVRQVGGPKIADVGDAQVDLDRHRRCGFPEVIFAEGKTVAAMANIFQALLRHGADVLATRMAAPASRGIVGEVPDRTL